MKKILIILVPTILVSLGIGFFAGMEYKSYQIKKAITNAFDGLKTKSDNISEINPTPSKVNTVQEQIKEEKYNYISSKLGEEITLATIKLKATGSSEVKTLSVPFGTPKVAEEGTKFVIVNVEITNITNASFAFSGDIPLVDNKDREYRQYSDALGYQDQLMYDDISPSIKKSGVFIYQVPNDTTDYSLVVAKAGSKDAYNIQIK